MGSIRALQKRCCSSSAGLDYRTLANEKVLLSVLRERILYTSYYNVRCKVCYKGSLLQGLNGKQ